MHLDFLELVMKSSFSLNFLQGAVAERSNFGAYLCYSSFITGFIYPVVAHWGWSKTGWLQNHGIETMARHSYNLTGKLVYGESVKFVDHAGSALVHCTGGICALMGAITIGPRIGKFSKERIIHHLKLKIASFFIHRKFLMFSKTISEKM